MSKKKLSIDDKIKNAIWAINTEKENRGEKTVSDKETILDALNVLGEFLWDDGKV